MQSEPAATPQDDLSSDVQNLPAVGDDPELEAALTDLDKQAELDDLMRRRPGPGQLPPLAPNAQPTATPPLPQPP
ncbi:hypothetical protein, partial [Mycobacterium avium]